jgi:hypothetical protein
VARDGMRAGKDTVDLRRLAEAAKAGSQTGDADSRALAAACTPDLVLALLDVAEAAEATHEIKPSVKGRWWTEDGMAGGAVADQDLRAALARWHEAMR